MFFFFSKSLNPALLLLNLIAIFQIKTYQVFGTNFPLKKGNNKYTNSEQSSKGKVKTHKYINRQNQSTTGKL